MDISEDRRNKPLKKKVFYLDLKVSKKQDVVALSQDLKNLGGEIEEFLSKDIKYVVTDRPNWKPDGKSMENWAPDTPTSTPSPSTLIKCEFGDADSPFNEMDFKRNHHQTSRGHRLLEQSTKYHKRHGSGKVLEISRQWGICILPFATVLKWVEKTKKSIEKVEQRHMLHQRQKSNNLMRVKKLVSPFIKVEDKLRLHRTFYKEFSAWPDIAGVCNARISHESNKVQDKMSKLCVNRQLQHTTAEGFAAKAHDMFSKKRTLKLDAEAKRKSYCEICGASYSSLQQHLVTKCHRNFLSDKTNYLHLNEVIATLPPVDKFLAEQVATCNILTFPKRPKSEGNSIPNIQSQAHRVKARRRVAKNLVHKFELCSITSNMVSSTNDIDEKENVKNFVEEERIEGSFNSLPYSGFVGLKGNDAVCNSEEEERVEGSCNSPPHSGFPCLEGTGSHAVETTFEKSSTFCVNEVPARLVGVADAPFNLSLGEESDIAKGDISRIFDCMHIINQDREVVPEVPVPESLCLNALKVIPPPDSILRMYSECDVDNNCQNVFAGENCIELGECMDVLVPQDDDRTTKQDISILQTVDCDPEIPYKNVPVVEDETIKHCNISVRGPLQNVECANEVIANLSAAPFKSMPFVDGEMAGRDNLLVGGSLQTNACDDEMIQDIAVVDNVQNIECNYERFPDISAAVCKNLPFVDDEIKTDNISIRGPVQNNTCHEMIQNFSAPACNSVLDYEITRQDNITMGGQANECDDDVVSENSAKESLALELLENSVISKKKSDVGMDVDQSLILLENQTESNNIINPSTPVVLPVTEIQSGVSSSILTLCQSNNKEALSNSEHVAQDLREPKIEEYVIESLDDKENLLDIKENYFSFDLNGGVTHDTIDENAELRPLNLCTRKSNPIDKLKGNAQTFVQKGSRTPVNKRVRGSSTPSRKVRILSDRSVLTLFDSSDDEMEFLGFKSDDKNKSSGLSYVEMSEYSEEPGNSELAVQHKVNSECRNSEADDNWDVSAAEFIERQVTEKPPYSSCMKNKIQPVDILAMDTSSNSADTGYTSSTCNKPPPGLSETLLG